jgi:phospholipid/cholesterol/gamma-HCH transport system substrate-binding protein
MADDETSAAPGPVPMPPRGSRAAVAVGLAVTLLAAGSLVALGHAAEAVLLESGSCVLTADFPSVGGLKPGAAVEIAGVPVGSVEAVRLVDDEAHVVLRITAHVTIPDTSVAVVKTRGLVGERYVEIAVGHGGGALPPSGRIPKVKSPVDLEDLLSGRIFGRV